MLSAPPAGRGGVRYPYRARNDSTVCSSGQDPGACPGYPSSNFAVQVRLPSSAIDESCMPISLSGQGPDDQGQNGKSYPDNGGAGDGSFVTSFVIP